MPAAHPSQPAPLSPRPPTPQSAEGGFAGNTCRGDSALTALAVLRGCQELSTSPYPPLVPRSWGQWPITVGDAQGTAGDRGGGGAVGWRPRDRQSQPGRLGVTSQEMPMDIPASNSCLGNSKSLLSSAADPQRLPPLLTALASSAGAGGSGPALVIMARLWDEAVKRERGREAPRL